MAAQLLRMSYHWRMLSDGQYRRMVERYAARRQELMTDTSSWRSNYIGGWDHNEYLKLEQQVFGEI